MRSGCPRQQPGEARGGERGPAEPLVPARRLAGSRGVTRGHAGREAA